MTATPRISTVTRLFRLALFALLAGLLIVLGIVEWAAWQQASAVLHPGCQGDLANLDEAGFPSEAITFDSKDGGVRRGWFTSGSVHKDVAIIVLPGHGGNTRFALTEAAILAKAGYSTLMFEHRSCADPSKSASTGIYEAQDVAGAVDYLSSRADIERIGAFGVSEGGTAVILAAGRDKRIEAVVDAGGYSSLADDTLDPPALGQSVPERIYRRLVLWSFGIQLGQGALSDTPVGIIPNIAPRPVFLIYGEYEADMGQRMYKAAIEPKSLWIVPRAQHAGYLALAPDEYPQRLVEFFDSEFAH